MNISKNTFLVGAISILIAVVLTLTAVVFQMNMQLNELVAERPEPIASKVRATRDEADPQAARPSVNWSIQNDPIDIRNWDPFQEMEQMQRRIDQMFGNAFGRFGQSPQFESLFRDSNFSPDFDLRDEGDHYVVKLDIPGADESEMNVEVEGRTLLISAVSKQTRSTGDEAGTIIHRERKVGSFQRHVTLPEDIDAATMETTYEDGVLTVSIKKSGFSQPADEPNT